MDKSLLFGKFLHVLRFIGVIILLGKNSQEEHVPKEAEGRF